jgi:hypothetical protein
MKLFIISLLLTFSEYNFYKSPVRYITRYNNGTITVKIHQHDPTLISLVTITNVLILNKMDWVYAANIYNLKALMYLIDDGEVYIDKRVEFTNDVCFIFIALGIL